jgi:hypothetical protein
MVLDILLPPRLLTPSHMFLLLLLLLLFPNMLALELGSLMAQSSSHCTAEPYVVLRFVVLHCACQGKCKTQGPAHTQHHSQ